MNNCGGRQTDTVSRRGFVKKSSLLTMTAVLGAQIPFAEYMPGGLIPAALANTEMPFNIPGKDGLTVHNDRPINAETPPHLLDDDVTPANRLFVRNNGIPPDLKSIDPKTWVLEISGESCAKPTTFTIETLKSKFTVNFDVSFVHSPTATNRSLVFSYRFFDIERKLDNPAVYRCVIYFQATI